MRLVVLFICVAASCSGAKILGVFNHPGASHTFLGKVLLENLAKRGHEIVMISSFPHSTPQQKYRDIPLPELLEDLKRREKMYFDNATGNQLKELSNLTLTHTAATFANPKVKELLKSNEKFDLIIMDWFFNEATLIFGHVFKAPIIYMSSFGNNLLLNEATGNYLPISYVPGAGLQIHDDMSFKNRAIMTVVNVFIGLGFPGRKSQHYEILKQHFANPPTIDELLQNVALVLSNSHFSFETVRPYTPNIIPIGGFHVGEPKQLPKDLQTFLDSATQGVIFFSLGSQIKSSNLEKEQLKNIMSAFASVEPLKVLWKFEEELKEKPKNVKIVKWIPQLEVLAHPNVKLFITHGGVLSFIEALHFGVPLLCIPFNGDQNTNGAFIESRGLGLQIKLKDITKENLQQLITEITHNQSYHKNVQIYSSLLKEQPIKPLDSAIFWVEHVIKHKGAPHLKPFATKLPVYKYYLIDVIGSFIAFLLIIICVLCFVVKKLWRVMKSLCLKKLKAA